MLKRTAVRFLLFGLGFALSYALTRPAKPREEQRIFVCEYRDAEHRIVIATSPEDCTERRSPQIRLDDFREAVANKWQDRAF